MSTRPGTAIGAAVGVALVAVAALLLLRPGDDAEQVTAAAPAGMAHVHGLGVDPADGALYAGTHYGLFRVPEQGEAEPIADRVQDFMGFTVVGAGHGGQSWQTVSLEGEADFHALEARHGRIYGSNGGATFGLVRGAPLLQLVTWTDNGTLVGVDPRGGVHLSDDGGTTWEDRGSVGGPPSAVAATEREVYVAVGERIVVSEDGGATFDVRYAEG